MSLPKPQSRLLDAAWHVPGHGEVRVHAPELERLLEIDRDWPLARDADREHVNWKWLGNMKKHRDGMVVTVGGATAAAWCGKYDRAIALDWRHWYRLDYLEVAESFAGLGAFVLVLIAARATELGATGIVGNAFNEASLLAFYKRGGADLECVRGWSCPRKMVPFCVRDDGFEQLRVIDQSLRVEGQR